MGFIVIKSKKMYCSFEECGDYSVPPLIMPCNMDKSCRAEPCCTPCLAPCVKMPVVYCCERPKPKLLPRAECEQCCVPSARHSSDSRQGSQCDCSQCEYCNPSCCAPPPPSCRKGHASQSNCNRDECSPCCDAYCPTPCKPVRTKYVIPCYRYEDGRIVSFLLNNVVDINSFLL